MNSDARGFEAFRPVAPRPLRKVTPSPTSPPPSPASAPGVQAASKAGVHVDGKQAAGKTAASPAGGTQKATPPTPSTGSATVRKARKQRGFFGSLKLFAATGMVAVALLYGAVLLVRTVFPGAGDWASEVFAGPDDRAWRRARDTGFDAVERLLREHPANSHAAEARAHLAKLAPGLPAKAESRSLVARTGVNLRAAPSAWAAEVGELARNERVQSSASVRGGDWLLVRSGARQGYAATKLLVERRARARPARRRRGRRGREPHAAPARLREAAAVAENRSFDDRLLTP